MDLLVFAFLKEAQSFIEYFNLRKTSHSFEKEYSDENRIIFICGPGIMNAKRNLPDLLQSKNKKISRIINIGIAGSVDKSAELNHIYSIREVFSEIDKTSHGIQSADKNAFLDCITVNQPVQGMEQAKELNQKAQIVDMELRAIASIASTFELPYYAIKYISDDARETLEMKEIIRNAQNYSDALCKYYIKNFIEPKLKEKNDLV